MKFFLVFPLFVGNIAAYAPQFRNTAVSRTALSADVAMNEPSYPPVNGWTADPGKFCLGLPGAVAPLGEFDPLGFTKDLSVQEIKRFREAEVTHGRVAMLATVGYIVGENFHPLFNGEVTGPANTHLAQVQEIAPFFFLWLTTSILAAELGRAKTGWESPMDAMKKNQEVDGKTWLSKLNDNYYPGDIGFDPLQLKPRDPEDFAEMQTKELNNGRLAMFGAIGMIVQEQVTGHTLF
uniref:Plastid light harvesting protein n=1 Tax=Corethron hystrix TaxID=216773 RepID=A0A7S1G0X2_9STRA|mmetsp:Transcript_8366/g.18278  ORF Transcript_8366/g.18278 Transcript_8366/m.18278 type:complete len:236 (+) Transcript_8366:386-1093(+)|eukprot:CAMPEP_0113307382 /NCGR_PEP_ID=MMETSP0010_2-20120614/6253_1 /TAXON_ID=216773 ORGANISM="Corethron hystrix, Strain 308" /NCGR_SAMPLE_ID=MMETSP0010_2 /ASSEMBLY_ACC=CAM_ASM_000155 /LENGTH=235 /DNA_ID=CAMNT_0000162233 /DNA_START=347 /DNA_END=1054 /DNA_ORIENTATION=- /assembly_acc=CAM_ASM_000155